MRHLRPFLVGVLLALLPPAAASASDPPMHAGQLAHLLDRVNTTARVLYVAAHPDDENTRLLAYLANQRHLVVGYLSLTRGGGGQNLIGSEQGELLGVIRTEELLAARRIDGAVQFFTSLTDFGYSKTATETLSLWGHDAALREVVRVIREFQPDVIITRFDELPPNHGHHTASAILAREAFTAAADAKQFPELKLPIWQASRLYHNFPTWRGQKPPDDALMLDVGAYDPRLGLGYGELAARSRSQHKSQGFGIAGERGVLREHFVWVAGSRAERDLLEGIPGGWERYGAVAQPLKASLDEARRLLDRDHPNAAIPSLAKAHQQLDALPDEPRTRDARRMLETVLVQAAGLYARATANRPAAIPGSTLDVQIEQVQDGEKKLLPRTLTIPLDAPVSLPFAPPLTIPFDTTLGGRTFTLPLPLLFAWTDRVQGERVRPVIVVPPATVTPRREAVLPVNGTAAPVVLTVRAGTDGLSGKVTLELPKGWRSNPPEQAVTLAKAGDEQMIRFEVTPPKNGTAVRVHPSITVGGRRWAFAETTIDYPHIPVLTVLRPTDLKLVPLALKQTKRLVGYIQGTGDSIAEDLLHIGIPVELLDDTTLRGGDLSRFSTIVVGVRAYNSRPIMATVHERLMTYVEKGGTLVVQYNTASPISPLTLPIGPYPLQLGQGRVTDETAKMTFLKPHHPMLLAPNGITQADFEGWVQERGIYFGEKWDPRYQPLFSVADPGEAPLEGSTLVADFGKGHYVYTGLAFFRQLRAGVPGAYRLFVNFLGVP